MSYALVRLAPDAAAPILTAGDFVSISRTRRELTIVCEQRVAPKGAEVQNGFRCIEIIGEYGLDAVGVVASATAPLAAAGISVFVFSVWSTDFLLVAHQDIARALDMLRAAGHAID